MKNVFLLITFLITLSVNSQNTQYQRYNIETGKVSYIKEEKKQTIIKTIIFKDWGAIELITETRKEFKGKKKKKLIDKKTSIIKLDKGLVYTVDEKEKKIMQMKNYGLVLFKNKNLTNEGKRISKANGGREVDHETILGYNCEVWKLHGTTTVIYKGVTLKSIVHNDIEIATKAQFNITVLDSDVALPDYPIINVNPWQDTEDAVDHYSTEEGQQEVIDAGLDTEYAYEDAKIMEWEEWYKKYKVEPQFKDATKVELREFYDESRKTTQERIDEKVQERINKRINNRINDRINNHSTTPIPKPRNPLKRIPRW